MPAIMGIIAVAFCASWLLTRYVAPFDVDRAVAARMPTVPNDPGRKLEFEDYSPSPFQLEVFTVRRKTL